MNTALKQTEDKLNLLLAEIRAAPEFERARAWVAKMTAGRSLAEYLRDGAVPEKERAAVAENLVEILIARDYGRLPVLATVAAAAQAVVEVDDPPAVDRAEIRRIVRAELGEVLAMIARVLQEGGQ